MPLDSGTRLGTYEIIGPIGAGGMGEVYRAKDVKLDRHVAVKVLPDGVASNLEKLSRFKNEAKTLASLNHPNIAAIYGLEEVGGVPYFILELVEGESLDDRLKRGSIELKETISISVQIAGAIEAAHERGIVHRDLKPGNIMITSGGVVKVLDFGLAKSGAFQWAGSDSHKKLETTMTTSPTKAGVIIGTIAYMSPEQARGHAVDSRSDIWSFACVVYECLSGKPAFSGETNSDLIARIIEREPDWSLLPKSTPPRVREILKRCLKKDMSARPRDIRDVRLELSDLVSGAEVSEASSEKSIAVLPLENLSGTDDEYFADGMTDELLNALGHVEGVRVAARSSCFAFKGRREDLRTVGEKLDVTTVLEGSVRRAGARLRITVQLVNTSDGYQLWSERYDREMVDIFEVQEEIAKAVATRLRGTLHAESDRRIERHGTKNIEAYELFLKGRALQNRRGRFLPEAVTCFEQAIALDSNYAEAMAWLSDSYRLMGTFGVAPPSEVMTRAKELAEMALAIDPNLSEAWQTLACVEEQYLWNYKRALQLWDKTFEIDPKHARGRGQRAVWGFMRGELTKEELLVEGKRAMQDEPLNSWVVAMHSFMLGFAGEYDESVAEAERSLALDPDSFFAHWSVMRSYAWSGQHQRVVEMAPALLRVSGRHPWVLGTLAWSYDKSGRRELAQAVCDEMEARARHEYMSPFWLAVAAASAGHFEKSIEYVECAVKVHEPLTIWGRVIPFWDVIRTHPRFYEVTRSVWDVK